MTIKEAFSSKDAMKYKDVRRVVIETVNNRIEDLGKSKRAGRMVRLADVIIASRALLSKNESAAVELVLSQSWFMEDNDLLEQSHILVGFLHHALCKNDKSTQ